MARKFLIVSRNVRPMRWYGKSRAILGYLWREVVDDTGHDRTRRPAVTGHGRHLVEDAAVQLDLLRLGEVQFRRERLDHHPVIVQQPEAVGRRDYVRGIEADNAEPHVGQCRE